MSANIIEGETEYFVPTAGKNVKIWYKIFGDIKSGNPPMLVLHGGPGIGHNYLLPLSSFAAHFNKAVIFFDQVGCGNSTHLPEKKGDEAFWSQEFFFEQIDRLLDHLDVREYDLFGHSWGGMMGSGYVIKLGSASEAESSAQKHKLRKYIICGSPASMKLWIEAENKLRSQLPEEIQAVLKKHEEAGTRDSKEFADAVVEFHKRYMCRLNPWPAELGASFAVGRADPTVLNTMLVKYSFDINGSLRDWSVVDGLHKIKVPTLVLNGVWDKAQDSVCVPFWEKIPKMEKYTFQNSSHTPHFEEPELFEKIVMDFLGN